ncbi:class II glutamine amidotransferase [Streptomyces sp. P38-E01]|uniref:Gamma-glutamyl-hercynylcysteine sulfoxide hydrolase n=1 Tax=Streptomyces tardus TaxID=2780544 RepID=A0A949JDT8_9ACTN|nr:class II glutamine amidotransferase [Streptomyces tardus]MBU7598091.1 class II glutamine amidotransferase [Streptomyces tardus]
MCRHFAYLGRELPLTELIHPPQGLYEQSWAPRQQRYGTVNADGFGLGWYPPPPPPGTTATTWSDAAPPDHRPNAAAPPPARYRRAVPIWADQNLPDLARTVRSRCVLGAVRDATPGTSQDESAAAPYRCGPWLFSHNGAVPSWQRLPDELRLPLSAEELLWMEARCDSALLWLLIHRRLLTGEPAAEVLAELVPRIAALRPGVRLNILLTDGARLTAVRHGDTLWCRSDADGVVLASEPDASAGWREVPDHTLVTVAHDEPVRFRPLAPAAVPPAQAAATERTATP